MTVATSSPLFCFFSFNYVNEHLKISAIFPVESYIKVFVGPTPWEGVKGITVAEGGWGTGTLPSDVGQCVMVNQVENVGWGNLLPC